jgi:hypothetical protein
VICTLGAFGSGCGRGSKVDGAGRGAVYVGVVVVVDLIKVVPVGKLASGFAAMVLILLSSAVMRLLSIDGSRCSSGMVIKSFKNLYASL